MVKEMVRANSVFLDEGRAVLLEEFDREHGVYFSILCAIARGVTTRNEIDGTYCVGEVKREKKRIDDKLLSEKFIAFQRATGKWKSANPNFVALSMEKM